MKSKWFALGCLSSFVVVVIIIFLVISGISKMGKDLTGVKQTAKVTENSFLHFALNGPISQYNEYDESYFSNSETSVHDIVSKIKIAANDENINGIFLEPNFISAGYADLNEIMQALENFRATGKEVISYLDVAFNKDYFLASISNRIFLNPSASAGIMLTGVGGNVLFYKDLFEKIGIDVTVLSAGKYKGAGETYSRSSFSEPVKHNITAVYEALYDSILEKIARNRNLKTEEIKYIYEQRDELFINHNKALDYRLVDELYYRDEVIENFHLKNKLIAFDKYNATLKPVSAYKIAVVYLQGTITPAMNIPGETSITDEKIGKILEDLMYNRSIKAIVLRVNSPGGSALISENIAEKLEQVKQQKPVVVSMGNVAASGGYYISTIADYIFADLFTITGSIGVVAMFPNAEDLTRKIGINSQSIGKGKYANSFNPYVKPNQREKQALQKSLQSTYLEFKQRVASGRNLSLEAVENIAQGQVWSSYNALENGLIDEIGFLSDAVTKAAELADTENYQTVFYPAKKNLLQELLKKGFDIDIAAKMVENKMLEELDIEEIKCMLGNIKQYPIQTLMPIIINP